MATLYLVDGHAQFFRAYHAIRPGMRSPVTNEPTNMTFGFVGTLLKLLREQKPDYLAVVIDASGDQGTFRSQIYPAYKAHRDPPPEDMDPQIDRCLGLLGQMRVPVLAVEGVEADDTIATVVRRMRRERPELEIRIVSRDKDLGQLVDERTTLYDPQAGTLLGVEELFESKGIRPAQVVDMLALMGDPVDNVPGVRGVGVKTAAKLIGEHGSLDNLLANIAGVKGKIGEAIAAQQGILPLSRTLVTLKDDVAVDFSLDAARVEASKFDGPALLESMHQLGFNQHREALRAYLGLSAAASAPAPSAASAATAASAPAARAKPAAPEEFGLFNPPPDSGAGAAADPATIAAGTEAMRSFERGDYRLLTTLAQLRAHLAQVRAACAGGALLAFDTETTSLQPVSAHLCGVSLSHAPGTAVYIPLRSPQPQTHLSWEEARPELAPLLADPAVRKTAHNAKFDLVALRAAGAPVRGLAGDSMVASYVVDATRGTHKMDALSEALLGHRCIPITDLIGTGTHQRRFDEAPLALAGPYAAEDADIALRLAQALEPQVVSMGLGALYRDVEVPLVEVLAELEFNGIRVDPAELERQRAALEETIATLRAQIERAAPRPFNIDSPKQLAEILFNAPDQEPPGLGLPIVKRTKTGASTDVEVLEKLSLDPSVATEIPARILEYRQLAKLVGTYLVALREAIDPATGRIHASFHQAVTATGRLSSSDPNLQNIPIRTEVGRRIRRAFVADPGCVLLCADYSQIELRVLAHLSGDPALIAAFEAGSDIHRAVAAEVYGVAPESVTDEQRSAAKMVNFGIVYGITPFGLARRLGGGTSNERAKQIIEDYKRRFAHIDAFLQSCVLHAREHGFVQTILGRRRAVPQIESRNPNERALGERIAINTVVQGSAADLIKVAMLRIHRGLPERFPQARMLLQIHDELVFEAPQEQVAALDAWVREAMEQAMPLRVPLVVSSSWGATWDQ
ncbi:MAG: DNA polymerase I [Phycisphaerales bacterium]